MANRTTDFNYKVALAEGLKRLQSGRLRQAEEQFRYLVQHFPSADGGYRGLAKVFVEQEDRPTALRTLLDGGARLAKAGERSGAIALYREATTLDAHDLTAHRRLAAALTLSGDADAAAREYVRYIRSAIDAHDTARAKLEAEYALERLPGNTEIAEAARAAGADAPAKPPAEERDVLMRSAFSAAEAATPSQTAAPDAPATDAWETAAPDAWESPSPARSSDAWSAPAAPAPADPWNATATDANATGANAPEPPPIEADVDAATVEATAARYLRDHDPRGGQHALEAARRYIADGRLNAASDLLLQLISTGVVGHDAQRLLVEVASSLGKRDVAKAKVQLLVEALRLDGRPELAAEVEQLAQAI